MKDNRTIEKLAYSVREAAEALGVSPAFLYRYIDTHLEFPHRRLDGRIVIPVKRLTDYINSGKFD